MLVNRLHIFGVVAILTLSSCTSFQNFGVKLLGADLAGHGIGSFASNYLNPSNRLQEQQQPDDQADKKADEKQDEEKLATVSGKFSLPQEAPLELDWSEFKPGIFQKLELPPPPFPENS